MFDFSTLWVRNVPHGNWLRLMLVRFNIIGQCSLILAKSMLNDIGVSFSLIGLPRTNIILGQCWVKCCPLLMGTTGTMSCVSPSFLTGSVYLGSRAGWGTNNGPVGSNALRKGDPAVMSKLACEWSDWTQYGVACSPTDGISPLLLYNNLYYLYIIRGMNVRIIENFFKMWYIILCVPTHYW